MRFTTITIFAVASRQVSLATANPVPNRKADGIAIPLTRHTPFQNNTSIDLDVISSHGILVEEKILRGLDNYEMHTGTMHPFAVKRSESGLERRSPSGVPLTDIGRDMWTANIMVSTPPQTLKVQIDTGTADLWVLQTGCSGINNDRDLWNPDSSTSAVKKNQPFQRKYEDGTEIQGDLYTDHVTFAGITADSQTLGSVTSYTSPLTNNGDADALLGLAFPSVSKFGADPLFESLFNQGKLINAIISFKLSSSGAEMYVGGTNSMLYRGGITYTDVTSPGYWQVSMDDVRINGDKILNNVPVIFDTGTSLIYGDWNQVAKLYGRLGGTLLEHAGEGYYYLPCDSFPPLGLTFGGRTFEIPPEVFRLIPLDEGSPHCFGVIIAKHSYEFWNIGNAFLQGVYSVFDYTNVQVGLADLA